MKKLKKFTAGLLVACSALCISPAVAFSPIAARAVFAEDEAITVEAGEAFEINAQLTTEGYNVRLDNTDAEMEILSENTYPSETEGSNIVYVLMVINSTGTAQVIIEDDNGTAVKTVSVNVTEPTVEEEQQQENTDEAEENEAAESGAGAAQEDNAEQEAQGEENTSGEADENENEASADEPEYLVFIPIAGGKISGKTESGEFRPGEKIALSLETDKGYVFSRWVIKNLDGRDVTKDIEVAEDNTFTLPDYPIRISAELNYNLIHEIELLDVTEALEVGKAVAFTGHVKEKTDARFFLLYEMWINEYDTKGITSSETMNKRLQDNGTSILDAVEAGDKYNYSVFFMTTEGYEFADDVKLTYNGKEYDPVKDDSADGKTRVAFSGFLSFGEQTNAKETKTTTRTVTHQETKQETVTQYVYNTYTYTTYQYVTRIVPAGTAGVTGAAVSGGAVRAVAAPATGDANSLGIWIAFAIAAGGGIVSGVLVGRRRKRK